MKIGGSQHFFDTNGEYLLDVFYRVGIVLLFILFGVKYSYFTDTYQEFD